MLGEETSSIPPPQNSPSLNSVSKLFRNLMMALPLVIVTPGRTSTLSLIPSWSGTKALFGGVSGELVEVTHIVPSPGSGLVATQPGGYAGAVTESKFSLKTTVPSQGVGVADTVGLGVAVGEIVGQGVPSQNPDTLKTICMFGKPIASRSVGVLIPQSGALM